MKVRGDKTEEEDEVVEANADEDQANDHLEQEDPRHSKYNPVPLVCTKLVSIQVQACLLYLILFLLQRSSF